MATSAGLSPGAHRPEPLNDDVLEVMNGPEDGRQFPLPAGQATIGRAEDAAVALMLDPEVSRAHARITREQGEYVIEDLGSSHGTIVGGKPIGGATRLADGDEIKVGGTILQLRRKQE